MVTTEMSRTPSAPLSDPLTGAGGPERRRTVYHAALVHSVSPTEVAIIPDAAICVDARGVIEWVEDLASVQIDDGPGLRGGVEAVTVRYGVDAGQADVVRLSEGFICPGFVDTHTHAPQYLNNGLGNDLQLLDWLEQITFPTEARFADVAFARTVYREVVQRSLNAGTTTSCYYATLHEESTNALTDICHDIGQRAFVGKCCMDRNSPDSYIEPSAESSLAATKRYLAHFGTLASPDDEQRQPPLVQPILTPRFAISCTPQLLSSLGALAASTSPSLAIQTHMSENPRECEFTKRLFKPEGCGETYAGVYEQYGLLGEGTILAHCVQMDEAEREVVRRTGAGVSHCPSSNLFISSGAARVRDMLDLGIKVGLGTDCSGGPNLSILSAIRAADHVAKFLSFTDASYSPFSTAELFYLATMGGARLCRLDGVIGSFERGKEFDAVWVRPRSPGIFVLPPDGPGVGGGKEEEGGAGDVRESEGARKRESTKTVEDVRRLWEKWIFCGDDRDLGSVWVRGRRVGGSQG